MKKYDIIVVGGGFAGVAAAISASRAGKSVLICEQSGALGGAMNNCLVYPFMNYWTVIDEAGTKKILSAGIFSEMLKTLEKFGGKIDDKRFNSDVFKCVLDYMVSKSGVETLFHAKLFEVSHENGKIKSLKFAVKSGVLELGADFFIDATGDGDVAYFSGCEMMLGREADNLCQPMTTCFRMPEVDIEKFLEVKPQIQELYKQHQAEGKITNPRENVLTFTGISKGVLHFNTTRVVKLNPTDPFDVSVAEMMAREQMLEIADFLKTNFECFKDAVIVSAAADIGVRESRMLRGRHLLTAEELKNCTMFPDGIALANYDMDIHNPEGTGTSHYYFPAGQYYSIPYASLVPNEIDNLLLCGRCISATHEAQASIRIMPICATTGEAAGAAAALILSDKADNKTVDTDKLRENLKAAGAAIE